MSTKRWLDEGSDADELEREILRAGLDPHPPRHAEREVLERLRATLGPHFSGGEGAPAPDVAATATAAGGTAAGAKGASTLVALFGKGLVVGAGFSLAAAGGSRWLERSDHAQPARAPLELPSASRTERTTPHAEVRAAPPETASESPRAPDTTAIPVVAEPSRARRLPDVGTTVADPATAGSVAAFPMPAAPSLTESQLREEARLLQRARAELREGALAAAVATLEASRRQFSAPELAQEREALAIELLYRSGETAVARERARAFIERFPESPHASRVAGFGSGER